MSKFTNYIYTILSSGTGYLSAKKEISNIKSFITDNSKTILQAISTALTVASIAATIHFAPNVDLIALYIALNEGYHAIATCYATTKMLLNTVVNACYNLKSDFETIMLLSLIAKTEWDYFHRNSENESIDQSLFEIDTDMQHESQDLVRIENPFEHNYGQAAQI